MTNGSVGPAKPGEYVSVSSQSDTERADLAREKQDLKQDPVSEREELARIYAAGRVK
jgi:VIT1/CCC1 family predicted Fe2+/Mn2+ transporter